MSFIINFIRFSRLHTVIGTTLSILALYLLALSYSGYQDWHLPELFLTLASCLGANIYIVGLNQITDVEIDRINKPYLPLASGAFSMRMGYGLITVSVLLSLGIAIYIGKYLLLTVLLSLALGTAYSLPPFRLKRFTFWAAFCIIAVRGLIVNLLLFLNFHFIISGRENIPAAVWLLTGAIFVYSIVIAWFKDIPDMEGDSRYEIRTLSLRIGARRVFLIGNVLISLVYALLIASPFLLDFELNGAVFAGAHLLLLALLWIANNWVDLQRKVTVQRYYQFIWVLFFLEYVTFSVAGLVGAS
ncbi:MAG: homogentisate phytyltransferase [Phaeodactylibacter sp.]|nr:homogentisate phytyltransferase [Phaeodactylibacter sp.]MCB9052978.1 homogentisate phytyltransferase [Lewinellaceae bacterium]